MSEHQSSRSDSSRCDEAQETSRNESVPPRAKGRVPYEPPKVESVELSAEAAEALT